VFDSGLFSRLHAYYQMIESQLCTLWETNSSHDSALTRRMIRHVLATNCLDCSAYHLRAGIDFDAREWIALISVNLFSEFNFSFSFSCFYQY
jgi:hypothetical protein